MVQGRSDRVRAPGSGDLGPASRPVEVNSSRCVPEQLHYVALEASGASPAAVGRLLPATRAVRGAQGGRGLRATRLSLLTSLLLSAGHQPLRFLCTFSCRKTRTGWQLRRKALCLQAALPLRCRHVPSARVRMQTSLQKCVASAIEE